jgi:hypothetical protein
LKPSEDLSGTAEKRIKREQRESAGAREEKRGYLDSSKEDLEVSRRLVDDGMAKSLGVTLRDEIYCFFGRSEWRELRKVVGARQ